MFAWDPRFLLTRSQKLPFPFSRVHKSSLHLILVAGVFIYVSSREIIPPCWSTVNTPSGRTSCIARCVRGLLPPAFWGAGGGELVSRDLWFVSVSVLFCILDFFFFWDRRELGELFLFCQRFVYIWARLWGKWRWFLVLLLLVRYVFGVLISVDILWMFELDRGKKITFRFFWTFCLFFRIFGFRSLLLNPAFRCQ